MRNGLPVHHGVNTQIHPHAIGVEGGRVEIREERVQQRERVVDPAFHNSPQPLFMAYSPVEKDERLLSEHHEDGVPQLEDLGVEEEEDDIATRSIPEIVYMAVGICRLPFEKANPENSQVNPCFWMTPRITEPDTIEEPREKAASPMFHILSGHFN